LKKSSLNLLNEQKEPNEQGERTHKPDNTVVEALEFTRKIMDTFPVGQATYHVSGKCIYANETIARIVGATQEQLISQNFYHIEFWKNSGLFEAIVEAFRINAPQRIEIQMLTAFGRHLWVDSQVVPFIWGGEQHVLLVFTDLTERHNMENELRKSEERFSQMAEIAGEWIWEVDVNGLFTYSSPVIERLLGYLPEELVAKLHFYDLFEEKAREVLKQQIINSIQAKEPIIGFLNTNIHKNGKLVILETNAGVIFDENGHLTGYLGSCLDLSERIRTQEELVTTLAELKRSNRELEEFAYVASHDLQEPLRIIVSYLQLVERRYKELLDDKGQDFIKRAVAGAKRMQTLIEDLLAYSRISASAKPFAVVDTTEIFKESLDMLRLFVKDSGANISADKLPVVKGDKSQIVRVFINLIGNAIKFCENKPEIRISATERSKDWLFSVADNGIGIQSEYKERVFEIFQRLHSRDDYPGTGIGLAISRKIVQRHGGEIWLESEPGLGTTFYFTIKK
jgi:PAS domain S-box-containing protein